MVVSVPREVYEAFQSLERSLSRYLNENEMNLIFLILVGSHATGNALTLKKFALKNPTAYLKALANGYTVCADNKEKKVAAMIKKWMHTPYKNNDIDKDIMRFAQDLTNYFQQQT